MRTRVKVALGSVGLFGLACVGLIAPIALSFPAPQGARIDGGAFVGVETGGAYAWVVPSDSGVVLVDAGMDQSATALKAEIGDRPVHAVFVTHGHIDHVSGLASLGQSKAFVGPGEAAVARGEVAPGSTMATLFGKVMSYPQPPPEVTEVQGNETMVVDGVEVRTIHLPGHTGGSMAYVIGDTVFTGDGALGHSDSIAPVHSVFCDDYDQAVGSLARLEGVASRLADGHAGLHTDLSTKLANTLK